MENKKNQSRNYNSLIWLLLTEYKDQQYTPSSFLLDTLKPKIDLSSSGLQLTILDSTLYDFKITKSVRDYIFDLQDISKKFDNSLIIMSFINDTLITRDTYLASLAKLYTCSDIAYINCPSIKNISTKIFDFIVTSSELPTGLQKIIDS